MIKKIIPALLTLLLVNIAQAADIVLTWTTPTEREDGSQIKQIDRFNLYHTANNVLQSAIEVSADSTSFQVSDVEAGTHTFQISTVEYGREGALSEPVSMSVVHSKPTKILLTVELLP